MKTFNQLCTPAPAYKLSVHYSGPCDKVRTICQAYHNSTGRLSLTARLFWSALDKLGLNPPVVKDQASLKVSNSDFLIQVTKLQ